MSSNYFDVINERFSCREFTDEIVSDELLNKIVDAGIVAPTAVNFQPEKIMVIRNPELIEKMRAGTKYLWNAKAVIVVLYDDKISWHRGYDGVDHGIVDASIVATHMMLAITALGLGSTYVCSMKEDILKGVLELSDNMHIAAILPLGYPAQIKPHNTRKNKEDIVIWK